MKAPCRVLNRDELHARGLTVDFDATEAWQQVGRPAMDQRAAIELGDDLNRHRELSPRTFHDVGRGNGSDEIAAERNERPYAAVSHGFAGSDRVEAALARGVKAVLLSEAIERNELGLFRDPDRALALDIRMASHRKNAGPCLPMLPRMSSKLLSIWIASTPERCCVRPMP